MFLRRVASICHRAALRPGPDQVPGPSFGGARAARVILEDPQLRKVVDITGEYWIYSDHTYIIICILHLLDGYEPWEESFRIFP